MAVIRAMVKLNGCFVIQRGAPLLYCNFFQKMAKHGGNKMAKGSEVQNTIFENLVKHLVEVEEQKEKLLEEYFPEPSKERDELKKLIANYIKNLESLIEESHKSAATNTSLPFVAIGSEVEIQDLSTQEVQRFRLVTPFSGEIGGNDVSYISPVGRALLLKRVGDEVTANVPAGILRYKINSIKWHGD